MNIKVQLNRTVIEWAKQKNYIIARYLKGTSRFDRALKKENG